MTYLALLRGINVGGTNKISMPELKKVLEDDGFHNVSTFLNTGNVIFSADDQTAEALSRQLEKIIQQKFQLTIPVLIRTFPELEMVVQAIPESWSNDQKMKCDVMFLWPDADSADILTSLPASQEFEEVLYVPGAVIWKIDREFVTKSKISKIVGTKLYKQMTVRNCNTARKLLKKMKAETKS